MIKWCDNLYMDDFVREKKEKYMKALEKEKLTMSLFCVTLASNENNLFDIICSNELLFSYYKRKDIYVVGLANGRENAIVLVQEIIEDIYGMTYDVNVKDYFSFLS